MALNIAHLAQGKELPNFELYYRNAKGKIEADRVNVISFLTTRGYFLYRTSVNKYIFIRIMDNIVCEVGKKDLVDEILNFVHEHESRTIYEAFLTNISKFFNDEFLRSLPAKAVVFRKDKKDAMQIYYQNCIVKITAVSISTHPYTELNGYIWESQILQRDFAITSINGESDFARFVFNISNQEDNRASTICSALGFMLHNFKNPAYCPAIILNDEVISDNPEGGTGKGILVKAIEQFVTTATEEGKTFSFDKNFVYQKVNSDTKLLFFQDVNKSFDFERLFSVLTDGIAIEKKGKDAIYIPFVDSPKIAITTNYAMKGSGNSHERRRFEIEISQYYNKTRNPYSEFGKMMFTEWDADEMSQFDNYMVGCCQLYLSKGLIAQELVNLPEKRLMAETSHDFLEFMETRELERVAKSDFYNQFIAEYPHFLKSRYFSKQVLSKWLKIYAQYKGYTMPEKDYIHLSIRYYTFIKLQS